MKQETVTIVGAGVIGIRVVITVGAAVIGIRVAITVGAGVVGIRVVVAVVAGVIGKSKFIYDLWGDTVNIASRMESHGVAGQIHVSEAVCKRVKDRFRVEPRGDIEIKGKGPMPTYLVDDDDPATNHHSPL